MKIDISTSSPIQLPRLSVRALPRSLPPVANETIGSFVARLAFVNHINCRDLIRVLAPTCRSQLRAPEKIVRLHLLAGATGIKSTHLAYALPEIRGQLLDQGVSGLKGMTIAGHPNRIHPACRLCMGAKNVVGRVSVWRRPDQNICLRHGIWIGRDVTTPADQFCVNDLPEMLQAQRRHGKLISRYGHRAVNYHYGHAHNIVDVSSRLPSPTKRWSRMLYFFEREKVERLPRSYSSAAMYPEAVALTNILISPYWRHSAVHGSPIEQDKFFRHIQLKDLTNGPPNLDRSLWGWIREHQPQPWRHTGQQFLDLRTHLRSPVAE
ncbi:TniQ family protein [Streptosporangium sp. NPDC000563]|uniref:TniQ family protein n=1 Tax=Streptosporangium sp. NPDC000563 TaxID=3154366 RepID=UPI00333076AD